MITVDTLRRCSYLNTLTLEELIQKNYPEDRLLQSDFLGITNGGQFAYKVSYPDDHSKDGWAVGKIFVWQNSNGELVADY